MTTSDGIDTILNDPPTGLPPFSPREEDRCVNFGQCGNAVRANNRMCPECLDKVRQAGPGIGDV